MRRYRYVGPEAIWQASLSQPSGQAVQSAEELMCFPMESPWALNEGATYVVDTSRVLLLAPRRSEHVACAMRQEVLAAGEIFFEQDRKGRIGVASCSNQSTGYCPDPSSFAALAVALGRLGLQVDQGFTQACVFRHCASCMSLNIVKDGHYVCDGCEASLPQELCDQGVLLGSSR